MKQYLSFILLWISASVNGQITKNNWIVGGTLAYSNTQAKFTDAVKTNNQKFGVSGNIGYFPIDKLALGGVVDMNFFREKRPEVDGTELNINSSINGVGPLIRYYFLPIDSRVNLLSEISLLYSFARQKDRGDIINKYRSFAWNSNVGVVIFLNSSIGVEMLAGYNSYKVINGDAKEQTIRFRIGLQIHLEK